MHGWAWIDEGPSNTKHTRPMFNYNYTMTPHMFCPHLPQMYQNNHAMCRFQHQACVDFNKPWVLDWQNTACSFHVSCILCRLWYSWHLSAPKWDSPSAMCYLTNQWITYNLPIYIIDAHIYWHISGVFPRWDSPSAHVIWPINELLITCQLKWGYLYNFQLYVFIGCTC